MSAHFLHYWCCWTTLRYSDQEDEIIRPKLKDGLGRTPSLNSLAFETERRLPNNRQHQPYTAASPLSCRRRAPESTFKLLQHRLFDVLLLYPRPRAFLTSQLLCAPSTMHDLPSLLISLSVCAGSVLEPCRTDHSLRRIRREPVESSHL